MLHLAWCMNHVKTEKTMLVISIENMVFVLTRCDFYEERQRVPRVFWGHNGERFVSGLAGLRALQRARNAHNE